MENTSEYLEQLTHLYELFHNNIRVNQDNLNYEQKTYLEISKIFSAHANKLATFANNINEINLKSCTQPSIQPLRKNSPSSTTKC